MRTEWTKELRKNSHIYFLARLCGDGIFSNWYQRTIVVDDFQYLHMVQYMMAQKTKLFHDTERYTQILRATTPKECKAFGKQI